MKNDRMMTILRLVIFLLISCVPGIFIVIAINNYLGAPMYSTPELSMNPVIGIANLCMLLPALANVITRAVTKQGYKDSLLEFNFKGKLRYYVMALIIPIVYGTVGNLITFAAMGVDFGTLFSTENFSEAFPLALYVISSVIPTVVMFFGEEFGWRGYLYPQLEKIMPLPAAVIVGGIIWGLWHAPLTISGHNFGTDYAGFPYIGILLITADCICTGAFLTLLTRRTKSVWPAVVAHGINNTATSVLLMMFVSPTASFTGGIDVIASFLYYGIPVLVLGIVSFVILCLDCKKEKAAAK